MTYATRPNRGFTLIEMLMTLALLGIVLAMAAPAFGSMIQNGASQSARSALTAALNTARMSAASKTVHVTVCPSRDLEYCVRTIEWQDGWIVFVDIDGNGQRDDGEALINVAQAQPEGVAIQSTAGRTKIVYRPDGSSTGSNVTLTVCDRRGPEHASALVINNAGRVRTGPAETGAAAACAYAAGQPRA